MTKKTLECKAKDKVTEAEQNRDARILARNVRQLRHGMRMNVSQLSKIAKLSRPVVYKVESGDSNIGLAGLGRIANALGVSTADLLKE